MLLHSGAGFHGHEFSPPNSQPRKRMVRSPFSASSSRSSSSYENTQPQSLRPIRRLSSVPTRKVSDRVSFQEPDLDKMLEDGFSCASEASETSVGGTRRKKRRTPRTSTAFLMAHPAPTLTREQRVLRIRPKIIFQLQQISLDKRPVPAIDVMPSTVVVPRIMKKFPRMFKGKRALGTNDVVIVRSERYDTAEDANSEDGDDLGNREVLAVICQSRGHSNETEICLVDGSIWLASSLGKHSYDFETTDERTGEITRARWIQRIGPRRQNSSTQHSTGDDARIEGPKFIFSIMNPGSRRHPVLASLTKTTLDIPDSYTSTSSSSGRYPPTSPIRDGYPASPGTTYEAPMERTTHLLGDNTRNLIQMTGIWVALKMGWSSYFEYRETSPGSKNTPTSQPPRPTSLDPVKLPPLDTRASTPESSNSLGGKGAKILRSKTHLFNRSPSISSSPTFNPTVPAPKRSISAGTAFMQRAAARRSTTTSSNNGSSLAGVDVAEVDIVATRPTRASTMNDIPNSASLANKRMSTPIPLTLSSGGSESSTLDTPTRPKRRVQSAYYVNSPLHTPSQPATANSQRFEGSDSTVLEHVHDAYAEETTGRKTGKWKQLLGFLRRGRTG